MLTRIGIDQMAAQDADDSQSRRTVGHQRVNVYPAAIIWDLDGTLIDSAPDLTQALNTLLREHGCAHLQEEQVRTMIGNGLAKLIERGFKAAGAAMRASQIQSLLPRFMLIYSACSTDKTRLYPGARSVLQHFSSAGVLQGICTNKSEYISKKILYNLEVDKHFAVVVGGDTTAATKPDPLPLRKCLEALQVSPNDAVMIGDSGVDVGTARAMKIPIGLVTFGYARGPVSELGADVLIDKLSSLPDLMSVVYKVR